MTGAMDGFEWMFRGRLDHLPFVTLVAAPVGQGRRALFRRYQAAAPS